MSSDSDSDINLNSDSDKSNEIIDLTVDTTPTKSSNLLAIINNITNYINCTAIFKSINIEAEVTEIREYGTMVYLKVADCTNKLLIIKAIIYKSNYIIKLEPGNKIKINCKLSCYKNELQLNIKSYQLSGQGARTTALTVLKTQLAKLGYFDNKKEIEQNYHTIGVISSLSAAGLKDFIHTINSRCSGKKIYLYPATMQGINAPKEVCSAINLANKHNSVQILVIIRGGGSKEDLECFNDKSIATSIHNSKLPIVTGIGHQIDISVADLVADRNFITPTATAQSITIENLLTKNKIKDKIKEIKCMFETKVNSYYNYITESELTLHKYKNIRIDKLNSTIHTHCIRQNEIKNKLQMISTLQYNYLIESETKLSEIQSNLSRTYLDMIASHKNNLNLIGALIKEKIADVTDKVTVLSRPKIINTETNEEVLTLKKFTTNQRYRINFIDGYYDIKIRKHI